MTDSTQKNSLPNDSANPAPEATATSAKSPHHTATDPRHRRRIDLMQQLFAYSFYETNALPQNAPRPQLEPAQRAQLQQQFLIDHQTDHPELPDLISQLPEIDETIQQFAPERPIPQINKVDLAILRSIMFEWKTSQTPKKVLIDEAVELAKEFGTESSPKFVNGVLAQLL